MSNNKESAISSARGFCSTEKSPFKGFMNIYIGTNGISFEGSRGFAGGLIGIVDSTGERYEIPWALFDSISKSQFMVIPGVTIKTKLGIKYRIVPVNTAGKWNRKVRNSFIDKINAVKPETLAKAITKEQKDRLKEALGPISDKHLEDMLDFTDKMLKENLDNIEKLRILKGDSYIEKEGIGKDPNAMYSVHFAGPVKDLSVEDLRFLKNLGIEAKFDQIHLKGLMLNQTRNYKDAILLYDIALKLDSSDSKAWFGKANALSGLDKFEEAIDCYDKMIALEPKFHYAHSNKALALMELGRFEKALQCTEQAIKLNPISSNLWSDKAKSLNHLEKFIEATVAAENAISLNNKNFWAWNEKAHSEMKLSNYSSAMQSLDEVFKIDPQNSYAKQLQKEIEALAEGKMSIIQLQQLSHGRILGKLFDFLKDNQGKAFTFKALNNRLEKFLEDSKEIDYCRENLQKILDELTSKGSIKSVQRGQETHYFFQETQQEDDDIFTKVFDKYGDALSERDKQLLRDAFSNVDKKRK